LIIASTALTPDTDVVGSEPIFDRTFECFGVHFFTNKIIKISEHCHDVMFFVDKINFIYTVPERTKEIYENHTNS
jgi:hypothetical protein